MCCYIYWKNQGLSLQDCSSTKVQFNQLQRIWDDLAQSVAQWKPAELLTQLPPPVVMSITQVLCGRELALWGSLARLLLGLLIIITGVTGDRQGAEFHTQAGKKSSLQHNWSWSCQNTAKSSGASWEPVNSDIAAVHFVSYIFIQYFPLLIAFRLEINFLLKSLGYSGFLISLFFFSFLSCFLFRNTFFSVQTLSCSIWFCPTELFQWLVINWLNSITRGLLNLSSSLAVTKYLCL